MENTRLEKNLFLKRNNETQEWKIHDQKRIYFLKEIMKYKIQKRINFLKKK